MNQSHPEEGPAGSAAGPPPPVAAAGPSGWTGGRITALVIGVLLVVVSLGLLGGGGTVLWVDRAQRDAAGYVTTGVHEFSTAGSALATDRIDLGSAGTGWLYAPGPLGKVRIRVTPATSGQPVFVGIAPSNDVDQYLAGVRRTVISDFWGDRVQAIDGATTASAPATQDFWVASATGLGTQTVLWEPDNGSWTVVVMNADGRAGVDAKTDLGARMPVLLWTAVGLLAAGVVIAVGGALLITGSILRVSRRRTV